MGDGYNLRNWGYYDQYREHLGLQLMSPMVDHRDSKPFVSSRDNAVMGNANVGYHPLPSLQPQAHPHHLLQPHHRMLPEGLSIPIIRNCWIQREQEKLFHILPEGNPNFSSLPEPSADRSMQVLQPQSPKDQQISAEDDSAVRKEGGSGILKKRVGGTTPKSPKPKKLKKGPTPKENGNRSVQRAKSAKKNIDVVINGIGMDISSLPVPVCSCTGTPQPCYRWGCGGWQSACCTTTMSVYPLPMSTKRRGARIAGRKMSLGAFKKVLEKLAAEGYNFSNAIDLKSHWAKHGTNKFVTIR